MKAIGTCLSAVLIALLSACGGGGGAGSDLPPEQPPPDVLRTYIKASNTGAGDAFGGTVAVSADGSTLVIAASDEDSPARGINVDQGDGAFDAGAVYVFVRNEKGWFQQAYIKASNAEQGDSFGSSVAISSDGNTLAVGASQEDGPDQGVNGDQGNGVPSSGSVYVFVRNGSTWSQQAYVKARNAGGGDQLGIAVALSGDGNTLAVGAPGEASASTTVDGDEDDNSEIRSGAVYVFSRSGVDWSQQAYIKGSHSNSDDYFGAALALSVDGNTLAVGAWREHGPEDVADSGAAYVFVRSGVQWTEQSFLRAGNPGLGNHFGASVALAADGKTLAVGSPGESNDGSGVNGSQNGGTLDRSGATYVFVRNGAEWTLQAYAKASNPDEDDSFGGSVALSRDGSTLVVGARGEDSLAMDLDGNQADNSGERVGAVYVFRRSGTSWSQAGYVKSTNSRAHQGFGTEVALFSDGRGVVVGAPGESGKSTGVDGDQNADGALGSGAVYLRMDLP